MQTNRDSILKPNMMCPHNEVNTSSVNIGDLKAKRRVHMMS